MESLIKSTKWLQQKTKSSSTIKDLKLIPNTLMSYQLKLNKKLRMKVMNIKLKFNKNHQLKMIGNHYVLIDGLGSKNKSITLLTSLPVSCQR